MLVVEALDVREESEQEVVFFSLGVQGQLGASEVGSQAALTLAPSEEQLTAAPVLADTGLIVPEVEVVLCE